MHEPRGVDVRHDKAVPAEELVAEDEGPHPLEVVVLDEVARGVGLGRIAPLLEWQLQAVLEHPQHEGVGRVLPPDVRVLAQAPRDALAPRIDAPSLCPVEAPI